MGSALEQGVQSFAGFEPGALRTDQVGLLFVQRSAAHGEDGQFGLIQGDVGIADGQGPHVPLGRFVAGQRRRNVAAIGHQLAEQAVANAEVRPQGQRARLARQQLLEPADGVVQVGESLVGLVGGQRKPGEVVSPHRQVAADLGRLRLRGQQLLAGILGLGHLGAGRLQLLAIHLDDAQVHPRVGQQPGILAIGRREAGHPLANRRSLRIIVRRLVELPLFLVQIAEGLQRVGQGLETGDVLRPLGQQRLLQLLGGEQFRQGGLPRIGVLRDHSHAKTGRGCLVAHSRIAAAFLQKVLIMLEGPGQQIFSQRLHAGFVQKVVFRQPREQVIDDDQRPLQARFGLGQGGLGVDVAHDDGDHRHQGQAGRGRRKTRHPRIAAAPSPETPRRAERPGQDRPPFEIPLEVGGQLRC